jgi:GNAT superfamily N-acetyltransferase
VAGEVFVRPMKAEEIAFALRLAAAEGWDPGDEDGACFYRTDPEGFLLAEADGAPVGCISAVAYGPDFGFIGLFIVRADARGRGYGSRLWDAAMARLGGRCIGLDAVLEERERYARFGFRAQYANARFAGRAPWTLQPSAAAAPDRPLVHSIGEVPPPALRAYDRACFPADRGDFVARWTAMPGCRALAVYGDGQVRGYGVIRTCGGGFKVAPLFADDAACAEALFRGLTEHVPAGREVYLDVPEANPAGAALAAGLGMAEVFRTLRMYRGEVPPVDLSRVFGVTSLELG